jgi:hypothetical protein
MKEATYKANAEIIEGKVRKFIRHYYTLKTVQGIIVTAVLGAVLLFVSFIIDFLFNLDPAQDGILFWSMIIITGLVSVYYIVYPLAQRMGIIKGLDYKKASALIAEKHENIEDRIVNIIELNQEKDINNPLFDEAINQKADNIKWYNFNQAVSVKRLMRLLVTATLTVLVIAGFSLIWPEFVKEGYKSVVQYKKAISKSEIKFRILNRELEVESGKDITIEFEVISQNEILSAEIKAGNKRSTIRKNQDRFRHTFFAVNNPIGFTIGAEGQESEMYRLEVLRRPEIAGMKIEILPPSYTGLEQILEESDGNLEIPSGSTVIWHLRTVFTDSVCLIFNDTVRIQVSNGQISYKKALTQDSYYKIVCSNANGLNTKYEYEMIVVGDLFPEIEVHEIVDSLKPDQVYIAGIIEDDFGFNRLELVEQKSGNESKKLIMIRPDQLYQEFYHEIVADTIQSEYFLRIFDNDQVNGYKFTESRRLFVKRKSISELAKENSEKAENITKELTSGIEGVDKLEEMILQFRMDNLSGEMNSWEIQERIKEITALKNSLLDRIESIQDQSAEYAGNEEVLEEQEMLDRAREIQELMKNLLDDELRELLEEFEKLSSEYNERMANDMAQDLEMNMEKLKEQMELSLELLKKFEINKEIENHIQELLKLAEKIENDTDGAKKNDVSNELEVWNEKYEMTLKRNSELIKPIQLNELNEERNETTESVKNYSESDKNEEGESRKQAAESVRKLAMEMEKECGGSMGGGQSVDIEELRQIRNSLNEFSRRQEELNELLNRVNRGGPTFGVLSSDQKILEEKFARIRDSLKGIALNQPIVAQILGQEMFHVETSFRSIMESISGNQIGRIRIEQNKIMSEVNSMALKLDELIKSNENQIGTGSGKKGFTDSRRKDKGESKGSEKLGETKGMQEALKEQLRNALQQLKEGRSGKKMRKSMAKMLGEREMMRKAAERLSQEGVLGNDAKERLMQAIEMMKEVERDIVYDRLGDHTAEKDEWIRTRLLEAENAEKERENDNRRESKEFKGEYKTVNETMDRVVEPNKLYRQTLKYKELKLKKFYQERYQKFIESTKN